MYTPQTAQNPRLFAHRGSALMAPENTIAAFDFATQYQCDVLETDVRLSLDGTVMVTHDETLERTTNGTGRVRALHVDQLKKLDAGCHFKDINGEPYLGPRQQLITLDELFEHYPGVGINIDIKDKDTQAATAVAKVVERYSQNQWINVGSFNAPVIKHFRVCAPNVSTAATRQEVARLAFGPAPISTQPYQVLQIPKSYWGFPLSRQPFIEKVQTLGVEIIYWTINDETSIRRLLLRGANGVVTDRADIARQAFSKTLN